MLEYHTNHQKSPKTLHQSSKTFGEPATQIVSLYPSLSLETLTPAGSVAEREEKSTPQAMSLADILKIADISRKYGPLFYQDPFIISSIDIPMSDVIEAPRVPLAENLQLVLGIREEVNNN